MPVKIVSIKNELKVSYPLPPSFFQVSSVSIKNELKVARTRGERVIAFLWYQ